MQVFPSEDLKAAVPQLRVTVITNTWKFKQKKGESLILGTEFIS